MLAFGVFYVIEQYRTLQNNNICTKTYCLTVSCALPLPTPVPSPTRRAPSLSYSGRFGLIAFAFARPPSYLLTPVPCEQAIKNPAEAGLVLRGADYSLPSNSSSESMIRAASGAYSSESRILFIKSRKTCAAFLALPLRAMVH